MTQPSQLPPSENPPSSTSTFEVGGNGRQNGDVVIIGPECFATLDGQVINWKGENYYVYGAQPLTELTAADDDDDDDDQETDVDTFGGVAVNDYVATTMYGVFNNPAFYEPQFESGALHPNLREVLLETPLLESESLTQVRGHARLLEEERRAYQNITTSSVVIRKRVIIETPYRHLDEVEPFADLPPGSVGDGF